MTLVLLACLAFLLGSFPSGLVLARLSTGRDIREQGSGNIGASNVSAQAGLPLGVTVGLLDMLKGVLPVLLARRLALPPDGLALVALCAVLGHNFSIFLRFRGGKGVATTLGVALVLSPLAALLSMVLWLTITLLSGYASVGSLLALAALPVVVAAMHGDASFAMLGIILFVLAAIKHWENILRLAVGREPKVRRPWS